MSKTMFFRIKEGVDRKEILKVLGIFITDQEQKIFSGDAISKKQGKQALAWGAFFSQGGKTLLGIKNSYFPRLKKKIFDSKLFEEAM